MDFSKLFGFRFDTSVAATTPMAPGFGVNRLRDRDEKSHTRQRHMNMSVSARRDLRKRQRAARKANR